MSGSTFRQRRRFRGGAPDGASGHQGTDSGVDGFQHPLVVRCQPVSENGLTRSPALDVRDSSSYARSNS